MTVSSTTTPIIQYSGNGVTVAFSTVFVFDAAADLRVIITDANGTDTVKTITTHYTVSGGSGSAGTVTMLTAPASGETLTIRRTTGRTQGVDYIENDSFPAESHEGALDKLTLITQELDEKFTRAVTVSETSGLTDIVLTPAANELLVWNATADGIDTLDVADIGAVTFAGTGMLVYDGTTALVSRTLTGTSNEITVTNGTGVSGNPTLSLPSALTFTSKTVTGGTFASVSLSGTTLATGTISTSGGSLTISGTININGTVTINDGNTNEVLKFGSTASAVNEVTITNAATSGNPLISATGGDTNIGLSLQAKGTGTINILGTASSEATLRLYEDTDNGSNYVGLKAPSSIASDITFTLPNADGTSGQVLQTNGSGTLSWASAPASAASQSDQETGTSTTTFVSPGRQQYHPSAAKAWVRFTSVTTTTITASYNVSSLTDNGAGDTTVNFTVAFSNGDYSVIGSCGPNAANSGGTGWSLHLDYPTAPTTSAARVMSGVSNGVGIDVPKASVVFFGDQ